MPNPEVRKAGRAGTATSCALGIAALAGLWLAVELRIHIAGVAGPRSARAGIVFGIVLLALAAALGQRQPGWGWRAGAWGIAGAAVLCVPVYLHQLGAPSINPTFDQFPAWAAVVSLVAIAEEALLRGALFEILTDLTTEAAAIGITAIAFALIHVPFYGWHVLPLDLAVGVALGSLRVLSGTVTAPAITHVVADLAGWWLR